METLVANCMELYHKPRKKMCGAVGIYSLVTAVLICLGYNKLYFELKLPNGSVGTAARCDGLYQQQLPDAVYLPFDQYSDRLGDRTGLDHRGSRTKWRTLQAGRSVSLL